MAAGDNSSNSSNYGAIEAGSLYGDEDEESGRSACSRVAHYLRAKREDFSPKEAVMSAVPLLQRLRGYSLKKDLISDLIAGVTVAILQVPQGVAYALLVGVAPAYGLYTSIFPVSLSPSAQFLG